MKFRKHPKIGEIYDVIYIPENIRGIIYPYVGKVKVISPWTEQFIKRSRNNLFFYYVELLDKTQPMSKVLVSTNDNKIFSAFSTGNFIIND